jgi:peptidoglycan/xylan/chitin deacetylase (PgdA/CDA1 family)
MLCGALVALLATGCATSLPSLEPSSPPASIAPGVSVPTTPETTPPASTPPPAATPSPTVAPTPTAIPSPSLAALPPGTVPILYYHRVVAPPEAYAGWPADRQKRFIEYDTIPAAFSAQLDWLKANGYTTILPRDLAAHWDLGTALPPRPVIISIDDGSPDWMTTILPMLQAHGDVAEFYLTLDAIATGDLVWSDVRRLAAAGDGIGAHDVHHVQLAGLGTGHPPASAQHMRDEVTGARTIIGKQIGLAPDSMAYVGGGFNAILERIVKEAGYTTARTINRGITQDQAHRFELRVVRVGGHDDVTDVVKGTIKPDLPTFAARMQGVSDIK